MLATVAPSVLPVSTLPGIGAPWSLVVLGLLGLMILAGGLAALLVSRR